MPCCVVHMFSLTKGLSSFHNDVQIDSPFLCVVSLRFLGEDGLIDKQTWLMRCLFLPTDSSSNSSSSETFRVPVLTLAWLSNLFSLTRTSKEEEKKHDPDKRNWDWLWNRRKSEHSLQSCLDSLLHLSFHVVILSDMNWFREEEGGNYEVSRTKEKDISYIYWWNYFLSCCTAVMKRETRSSCLESKLLSCLHVSISGLKSCQGEFLRRVECTPNCQVKRNFGKRRRGSITIVI